MKYLKLDFRFKVQTLWGRAMKQRNRTETLKKFQLTGGLTSWLFTKRDRGFELGTTMKQIQAGSQRRDWNLKPPDYESAPLTTRRPHRLPANQRCSILISLLSDF